MPVWFMCFFVDPTAPRGALWNYKQFGLQDTCLTQLIQNTMYMSGRSKTNRCMEYMLQLRQHLQTFKPMLFTFCIWFVVFFWGFEM